MNQIYDNSLFLHASSVVIEKRAVLFLGHSTAGKSTIARLLSQNFQVLADDTVFAVRKDQDQWFVFDGKNRSRKGCLRIRQCAEQDPDDDGTMHAPLAACIRIFKSNSVRMEFVAPVKMARYLMDAVMEVDLQRGPKFQPSGAPISRNLVEATRSRRLRWFRMTAEIASTFSGWDLWFPNDPDSPDLTEAVKLIAAGAKKT